MKPHRFAPTCTAAAVLLAFASADSLRAADGEADTTFSTDGQTTYTISSPAFAGERARAVAGLEDGSLLIAGTSVVGSPGFDDFAVVKYGPTGTPELSFGNLGSRTVHVSASDLLFEVFVGGESDILLAGRSTVQIDGDTFSVPTLVGLTADGDLDPDFGDAGVVVLDQLPWPGTSITLRDGVDRTASGAIVFYGTCTLCPDNAVGRPFLVRLLADGTPDPSFDGDGWAVLAVDADNSTQLALDLDAAGRNLVAVTLGAPTFEIALWRLTASGAIDTTFGGGDGEVRTGISPGNPIDVLVSPDNGRIFLRSVVSVWGRLADGATDAGFGTAGVVHLNAFDDGSFLSDFGLQSDGKLVFVGGINPTGADLSDFFLARLSTDGTLDPTFDGNGVRRVGFDILADGTDNGLALTLSGGRLVAVGYATADSGGAERWAILRTESALVFRDGFERGSTAGWLGN